MLNSIINFLSLIWFLFFAYWTGAIIYEFLTRKNKSIKKRESLLLIFLNRLFLYVSVFIIFITPDYLEYFPFNLNFYPKILIITYVGLALVMIGILFAIWARITLGTNWSADVNLKKEQNLIKNGPYNFVRHPIYSGITLAVIGSVIVENALIGIIAVLSILLFSYLRIKAEERLMKAEFGKEYEDYAKSVKTFVPWIW